LYSANGDIDSVKPNSRQHDTMFRNLGGKQFVDVSALRWAPASCAPATSADRRFGDLNNDGFEDLVVTSLMERPRILLNSGGQRQSLADAENWWGTIATATPSARK
jgi:hypothetical protein